MITISGQNLDPAIGFVPSWLLVRAASAQTVKINTITTNAQDISGGTGVVIKTIRWINNKLEADISISPTTKDGKVQFNVTNKNGKSATVDLNIQITGTQWLTRTFPLSKRIKFFGDWPVTAPNQPVKDLADQINVGLQAIGADSYKQLDIWINIYENSFWFSPGVSSNICGTLPGNLSSSGCAPFNNNIIHSVESMRLSGTILHESAHKLHTYYNGSYMFVIPRSSFPSTWIKAVGDISNCPYLPLQNPSTWKDGTTAEPHCGFIRAYGAYDSTPVLPYAEDVATMADDAVFSPSKFSIYQEVKTDPRYKQKLDLLKQYGFIQSSPLGYYWIRSRENGDLVGNVIDGAALTDHQETAIIGRSNWNWRKL